MGGVKVVDDGLVNLVKVLKGPKFRNINAALREYSPLIAEEAIPHIRLAVSMSPAPQARAMAATVRTKRDRVPVIFIGKVNPRFRTGFKGGDTPRRRGSIAHGVVYGPKGGHRGKPTGQNFYKIPRNDSGGRLGQTLRDGPAMRAVERKYLQFYIDVLTDAGFKASV